MEYINLGKKIREERIKQGLTQEVLGEKIDSTGSYIGQIERGERNASMEKVLLIAEELKISLDYLVGNTNNLRYIDEKLEEEIKGATNEQKEMLVDIMKIIKKYK